MDHSRQRSHSLSSAEQPAVLKRQRMDEDAKYQELLKRLNDKVVWDRSECDPEELLFHFMRAGRASGCELVKKSEAARLLEQKPSILDALLRKAFSSQDFSGVFNYRMSGQRILSSGAYKSTFSVKPKQLLPPSEGGICSFAGKWHITHQ
jgi:hypothetical protein